jgi:membrane protein DedA with SNARE-associated domain
MAIRDPGESFFGERKACFEGFGTDAMVDELLIWLSEQEGPAAYLVLALASALEYIAPPLPGDTVALFGTFLAATAGYDPLLVYLVLTGGSIGGSLVAWSFGLYIGRHESRWPRFLRGDATRGRIRRVIERFESHGAIYLSLNRFLPALRALFFVAAGMAGMRAWKVVVFGGLSAAVWNLLILLVGFGVGENWEKLASLSEGYTYASLGLIGLVALGFGVRWLIRRSGRRDRAA